MNIFGYIIIVITFLLTVVIGIKQPPMHTRVLIYDSQYTIVDENKTPPKESVVESKEIPTIAVNNNLTQEQRVFEQEIPQTVKTQQVKTVEQPKTTQTKKNNVVTQKTPTTVKTQKTQPVQKTVSKPVTQTVTKQKPVSQTTQTAPVTTVKQTTPVQTVQTQKVLTAQEELVAWNIWHSNLQNQIIKDSKLPILPMGTAFEMTFDVDKYGRVSNVQTWSTNPQYTPYAIEFIAPVIRSYQGKAILDFPQGSLRTKNHFVGRFKIAQSSKYSTPNDYHDIEKVVK